MKECTLHANIQVHKNNKEHCSLEACLIAIIISSCVTSESRSEAAGMATPAAEHSHLAAAASVGVFPSAPGWNVQLDRSWSYSWEKEPHCQRAVVASAAKTSVFRTSYSPEAWSVGRHRDRSQCFKKNPGVAPWNSLFANVLMTQNIRTTTMEAERLDIKLQNQLVL